jgi:hypothetical protein
MLLGSVDNAHFVLTFNSLRRVWLAASEHGNASDRLALPDSPRISTHLIRDFSVDDHAFVSVI